MNLHYIKNMKEHSDIYWWFFDRIPHPIYRAWRWVVEKPLTMKANHLRKRGKVPREDAWNSDITICDMLSQHLDWHIKWLEERFDVFPPSEEDKKFKQEMERARNALKDYAPRKNNLKTTKQSLAETRWAINWVGKNVSKL